MRARSILARGGWYAGLAAVAILALAPVAWMFVTACKPESTILSTRVEWLPRAATAANFQAVLTQFPMLRWSFNSIVVATVTTVTVVLLTSLAGYALARMEFWGRELLLALILAMLFVPIQIVVVPLFLVFARLELVDTYTALMLPLIANVTGVFIMRQFFLSIPPDLEEAARVDGAGDWRIWWSVIMPLARPAVSAVAILTFLAAWNSFFWPLIATRSDLSRTLPMGLAQFMSLRPGQGAGVELYGRSMAGAVIASIVPLVLFLFLQRQFVAGVTTSGIKG